MSGKNFQIYGVHIPRKCIESGHFYSCSSPFKTLPQVLVITPRQKEICHSLRQHFFENMFPRTAESGGGNYDLLYQNSIRKYEHELKLRQGFYMVILRYIKPSLTTLQNLDLFYQQ